MMNNEDAETCIIKMDYQKSEQDGKKKVFLQGRTFLTQFDKVRVLYEQRLQTPRILFQKKQRIYLETKRRLCYDRE